MRQQYGMQKKNGIKILGFLIFFFALTVSSVAVTAEIAYRAEGRRDPFIPLQGVSATTVRVATASFSVEGIIYDPPAKSLVVISGETYKVGDDIGQAKILEIRKDRVIIEEKVVGEVEEEIQQRTLWIRDEEQF